MSNKMLPLFLLCETPLHAGVGSDVGIVDLPIQRERHTSWPKIEASGVKGSIRNSFEMNCKNDTDKLIDINILFGYDDNGLTQEVRNRFGENKDFSGALGFTDARILLFPVKSLKGVFAWVTCPGVLGRFYSDLKIAGIDIPKFNYEKNTIIPNSSCLIDKTHQKSKIILEEFTIEVKQDNKCEELGRWLTEHILPKGDFYDYLREKLKKDLVILSDDLFTEFTKLSTEIITRTKIDNETGTVKGKALFTEEYLPTETIMYSFAILSPIFSTIKGSFKGENQLEEVEKFFREGLNPVIQIGGNSNLGKGLVSTHIFEVKQNG